MTLVPVSSDDILAVSAAWELLAGTSPIAGYQRVQVLTVANQAIARMTGALGQASGEMPPDPVDGASEAVVMDAALMDRYQSHGFSREESFALVHATVQASDRDGNGRSGSAGERPVIKCGSCGGYCMHAADCAAMAELEKPFTLSEFYGLVSEACKAAWDYDQREVGCVTLPFGAFPWLSEVRNPVTHGVIPVRRVGLTDWDEFAATPVPVSEGNSGA